MNTNFRSAQQGAAESDGSTAKLVILAKAAPGVQSVQPALRTTHASSVKLEGGVTPMNH